MPVTLSLVSSSPHAGTAQAKSSAIARRLVMAPTVPKIGRTYQLPLWPGSPWGEADLEEVAAGERAAHLRESLLLELADALAREVVLVADLLERQLLLGLETEALAQDVGLDRAELAEERADLGGHRLPLE